MRTIINDDIGKIEVFGSNGYRYIHWSEQIFSLLCNAALTLEKKRKHLKLCLNIALNNDKDVSQLIFFLKEYEHFSLIIKNIQINTDLNFKLLEVCEDLEKMEITFHQGKPKSNRISRIFYCISKLKGLKSLYLPNIPNCILRKKIVILSINCLCNLKELVISTNTISSVMLTYILMNIEVPIRKLILEKIHIEDRCLDAIVDNKCVFQYLKSLKLYVVTGYSLEKITFLSEIYPTLKISHY